MKKLFVVAALAAFSLNAAAETAAPVSKPKYKLITGRAVLRKGNIVDCYSGSKTCAVVNGVNEDPDSDASIITVFDENGAVIGEYACSTYTITEESDCTSIEWLP